jgi:hypothetical protein
VNNLQVTDGTPGASMSGMVPAVNPADLKNVWRIVNLFQAVSPSGQSGSIGSKMFERACSDGADIEAIWFRATVLQLMPVMLSPWTHNGELEDEVFQVAASFPMKKIEVGIVQEGPPFDVQEFLKQVEQTAKA